MAQRNRNRKPIDLDEALEREKRKTRRLESALQLCEERYNQIFADIRDIYFVADADGRIRDISPSAEGVFEQTRENLIGRSLQDFFARTGERDAFLARLEADARVDDLAFEAEGPGKQRLFLRISASRRKTGFAGLIRNVTPQKEAEDALEKSRAQLHQSQKMEALGTLVAGVAHEINNPVNLILYNTPLLKRVWHDLLPALKSGAAAAPGRKFGGLTLDFLEQNLEKLVADVDLAANRVAKIVTDLKNFARRSSVSDKRPMALNEAVENAMRLMHTTLRKAGITVELDLAADLPPMNGNLHNIEQIVMNILINAVQAIDRPGGRVRVETGLRPADGRVFVSIADNGKGVDPAIAERLFDPFVTDKQSTGGTGLGLSVSYSLVKAHDGDIDFNSEPGRGTTFHLTFPTEAAEKQAKILVVDDDAVIRRMLTRALTRRRSYRVEEAANGIEACLKLGTYRPDLLILDVFMPDMDGVEVCRALTNDPELSSVKVVITTGHPNHAKVAEAVRLGFANIVSKPFDVPELLEFIDNILTS